MLAIGLQPGVEGSWFQPLKLVAFKPAEKAKWSLVRGSSEIPLQFGIDFVNTPAPATPSPPPKTSPPPQESPTVKTAAL